MKKEPVVSWQHVTGRDKFFPLEEDDELGLHRSSASFLLLLWQQYSNRSGYTVLCFRLATKLYEARL